MNRLIGYSIELIEGVVVVTDQAGEEPALSNVGGPFFDDLSRVAGDLSSAIVLYHDIAGHWYELCPHGDESMWLRPLSDTHREVALGWARSELLRRAHQQRAHREQAHREQAR